MRLRLVLGDQLDRESAVLDDVVEGDLIWMAEVDEEATHVWCHKYRIAYFFSAMRHFRDELREAGHDVRYHELTGDRRRSRGYGFADHLSRDLAELKPEAVACVLPGDIRVRDGLKACCKAADVPIEFLPDRHFYVTPEAFDDWAEGRKTLTMEYFYREMRKRHDVLMDGDEPAGGRWNFDHDNRESFGRNGPPPLKGPMNFTPDTITADVFQVVEQRYADHPGRLEDFRLPVTQGDARRMLTYFVKHSLPLFGTYEDAMWTDEPFLYHSRLSAALNLKLLNPRECVDAAVAAWRDGQAELNAVEGFVRQILGWREFVRGIYWSRMPDYAELNAFDHTRSVPDFFWTGETDMTCVHQSMQHVLRHGYAHHIHRLMVLGNFALLAGVDPLQFHRWHMAMYVDAVDWVSLPNTLGMSQYGDGGIVGTKPYVASGNYINKMSNFCGSCRYDYRRAAGEDACPVTTLYWDFLARHEKKLSGNRRMKFQLANLKRKRDAGELDDIRRDAAAWLDEQAFPELSQSR